MDVVVGVMEFDCCWDVSVVVVAVGFVVSADWNHSNVWMILNLWSAVAAILLVADMKMAVKIVVAAAAVGD